MKSKSFISPREFGEAIGVSSSSMKRWVDSGRVRAPKTAGGHRRIELTEAVRFIRETGMSVQSPELFGLHDPVTDAGETEDLRGQLEALLRAGDPAGLRSMMFSQYLGGLALPTLFDAVAAALAPIGDMYETQGTRGIAVEHAATDACIAAIHHLKTMMPEPEPNAPVAVGGAASGVIYTLPSLMVSAVAAARKWQTTNLGPDTPIEVLLDAARQQQASVIWLSLSFHPCPAELSDSLIRAAEKAGEMDATLIVGGADLPRLPTNHCLGVQDLAAFDAFLLGRSKPKK